jgi:hypothetical protein
MVGAGNLQPIHRLDGPCRVRGILKIHHTPPFGLALRGLLQLHRPNGSDVAEERQQIVVVRDRGAQPADKDCSLVVFRIVLRSRSTIRATIRATLINNNNNNNVSTHNPGDGITRTSKILP